MTSKISIRIRACCGCSADSTSSCKARTATCWCQIGAEHKALWPILGRPGAVLSGTEIIGSWRPKSAGKAFTLRLELWTSVSKAARRRLEVEAERLAAHRGQNLEAIVEE